MALETVSERKFARSVLQSDAPVLVAFRASWCAASERLQPVLDDVAAEYDGRAKTVHVDVDDPRTNKLCRRFKVSRLPVVMLFDGGQVTDLIGGVASKETVADMVESRLKPVIDAYERNFDAEVLRQRDPVLAHFHAGWCNASVDLLSIVEDTAKEYRGRAKVVRVDFDENPRLAARYGIFRVPTLALFHGGEVKDQILGAMSASATRGRQASSDTIAGMLDEFLL